MTGQPSGTPPTRSAFKIVPESLATARLPDPQHGLALPATTLDGLGANREPQADVRILTWPFASSFAFLFTKRSSTFAAGQVKRQVVPEAACSSSEAPMVISGNEVIIVLPKPVRSGGDTVGPSYSIQLIVNTSSPAPQPMFIRPPSTDSAPYLVALVASSWSARPMTSHAAALIRRFGGPCSAIRTPIRSAKCASWVRIRSATATPCHSFRTSNS